MPANLPLWLELQKTNKHRWSNVYQWQPYGNVSNSPAPNTNSSTICSTAAIFSRIQICNKLTLKDGKNGKKEKTGEEYKGTFSKCSVTSNKSEIYCLGRF